MSVPKCPIVLYGGEISQCQNVHLPKYSCAQMSQCRSVPMLKCPCSPAENSPECSCAGTPMEPKSPHAEMFRWWNVRAEMSLAEMSGAEKSPSLQYKKTTSSLHVVYIIWQYRLWSFQGRDTKLESFFLLKINCSQMKSLNFCKLA